MSSPLARIGRALRSSLVLGSALVAGAGVVALRPDLMLVQRVEFEGQREATAHELRHLADLPNGTRIWEVDTDVVERAVERHPWVRRATATRHLDRVHVSVEEYRPVALLHYEGAVHYVAEDGAVFLPAQPDDLDHPSITGIAPSLEARHPDLPRLVIRDALALLAELDGRGLATRDLVQEVSFSADRGFTVTVGRARVLFGLRDRETQLDRLAALRADGRVAYDQPVHVDLGPRTVAVIRPIAELGPS